MAMAAALPAPPIRGLIRSMERIADPMALRRVEDQILRSIPHLRPNQMLEFLEVYSRAPKISPQVLSATWEPLKHLAWYWNAKESAVALRTLSLMGRDAGQGVRPILDRLFGDFRTDLYMLEKQEAMSVVTSLAKLNLCTYERLSIMLEESGLDLSRGLGPADLCALLQIFDQLIEETPESQAVLEQAAVSMQTAFRLEGNVASDQVLPLLSTSLTLRHLPRSEGWHRFLLQKLRGGLVLSRPEDVRALMHVALLSPKSKDVSLLYRLRDISSFFAACAGYPSKYHGRCPCAGTKLCRMIPSLAQSMTQMMPQLSMDDFANFFELSKKLEYRDDYTMDRIVHAIRARISVDSRDGKLELLRSVERSRTLLRALNA
eukprot:GEMP01067543.1.p1 GENE.GEMP01067543.1~~GEMP01067543.1.p1  ORF type:complete len:375 (+),score=77.03 GEMP01067543.1:101-1225(+)